MRNMTGSALLDPRVTDGGEPGTTPAARRIATAARTLARALLIGLALYFVASNALRYLAPGGRMPGRYIALAPVIRLHVTAGMAALFAGLAQFRTGPSGARRRLHRWMGRAYLAAIAAATLAAAALLAREIRHVWVATSGLAALAAAWVGTSALAWLAIRRGQVLQHREWMARSYTVTFAFVTYRLLVNVLAALHVGTGIERAALASWSCWAVPLLAFELVLQGRKIFTARPRRLTAAGSPAALAAVLLTLSLTTAGCAARGAAVAPAPVDRAAEVTKLRETAMKWQDAMDHGPTDAVLRYLADDIVALYPKPQPTVGLAANRAAWDSVFVRLGHRHFLAVDSVEVAASGELGYVRGRWRTRSEGAGATFEHGGRFLSVWRRVGADWRQAVLAVVVQQPVPPIP